MEVLLTAKTLDLWFSHSWVVIVAVFAAGLVAISLWVAYIGVRQWQRENEWYNASDHARPHPDYNTTALIAGVATSAILFIMSAILNVGQATELMSDNNVLTGISWLYGAVLGPLVAGKIMNKFTSDKYGSASSAQGGAS